MRKEPNIFIRLNNPLTYMLIQALPMSRTLMYDANQIEGKAANKNRIKWNRAEPKKLVRFG